MDLTLNLTIATVCLLIWPVLSPAPPPAPSSPVHLDRIYQSGETLQYQMTGDNAGWQYQVQATSVVKEDTSGAFYEEVGWSHFQSNASMSLSQDSLHFHQELALDGTGKHISVPDLSKVQPFLIGPITDMLTFYADVLVAKQQKLLRAGQHAYFAHGTPNSWADGQRVILGQDSIDFDLTLLEHDAEHHRASLLIRHVPPQHPHISLPAAWMQAPVSGTPNNWVQIAHADGKYIAQVGQETFDVRVEIDTGDGKIDSAHMENPLVTITRQCEDAALTQCGPATRQESRRVITLRLLP